MSGPRLNAAFYAAPVEEFLAASDEEVYAPLASPHGYTLAPEQQSAWRLQLPVLRAALEELVAPPPDAPAPWIHLEFDIPRLGRRVDAVLVTQKCVIPIEFKVGAHYCPVISRIISTGYDRRPVRMRQFRPEGPEKAAFFQTA